MTYAILSKNNSAIDAHGTARNLWPDTSFANDIPDPTWLAQFNAVAINSDLPYDAATEMLIPAEPYVLNDKVYNVVKAQLPPAVNLPRWNNFAASLMANPGVKQFLGNIVTMDAAAYGGLIGGLVQASNNQPEFFLLTWMEIKKQGVIPEQLSAFVVLAATQNDLPEEFIQSLAA
jgi:hypothetical protein